MGLRGTLVLALVLLPSATAAQLDTESLFEDVRTEMFVRLVSERIMLAPRSDVCLGLGGTTTPVEDPSPEVVRRVAEATAEQQAEFRFDGELVPFSACADHSFDGNRRDRRRAIVAVVEHLRLDLDRTTLTAQGHAGTTGENVLDCRFGVSPSGASAVEACGVWHEHFGYTLKVSR